MKQDLILFFDQNPWLTLFTVLAISTAVGCIVKSILIKDVVRMIVLLALLVGVLYIAYWIGIASISKWINADGDNEIVYFLVLAALELGIISIWKYKRKK